MGIAVQIYLLFSLALWRFYTDAAGNSGTSILQNTYTSTSGTIKSPGYPGYPKDVDYIWIIKATPFQINTITINELDLERHNSGRCYDGFYMMQNVTSIPNYYIPKACSKNALKRLIFRISGDIIIRLSSDKVYATGVGFSLSYSISEGQLQDTYSTSTGTIQSPNYPGYPLDVNYHWIIKAAGTQTVTITITYLSLETNGNNGCFDILTIYQKVGTTFNKKLIDCQKSRLSSSIISVQGETWVHLISDYITVTATGFHLSFIVSGYSTTTTPKPSTTLTTTTPTSATTLTTTTPSPATTLTTTTPTPATTLTTTTPTPATTLTTTTPIPATTLTTTTPSPATTLTTTTPTPATTLTTTTPTPATTLTTTTPEPATSSTTTNTPTLSTLSSTTTPKPSTLLTTTTTNPDTTLTTTTTSKSAMTSTTTATPRTDTSSATRNTTTPATKSSTTTTPKTTATSAISYPRYYIQCVNNCGSLVKVSSSTTFKANCQSDCLPGEHQHIWSIQAGPKTPVVHNTGTVSSLYIKAFDLDSGMLNTLTLEMLSEGATLATTTYSFTTNRPPKGAVCSVNPMQGHALEKEFVVSCNTSQVAGNGLLSFDYKAKSKGANSIAVPVHNSGEPTTAKITLPLGNPLDGYKTEIIMSITDSIGDFDQITTEVTVLPSTQPTSALVDELNTILSTPVTQSKTLMEAIDVLQNVVGESSDASKSVLASFRQSLAQNLADLPITNQQESEQHIAALDVILDKYDEINTQTQISALNATEKIASSTKSLNITKDKTINILSELWKQISKLDDIVNYTKTEKMVNANDVIRAIMVNNYGDEKAVLQKVLDITDNVEHVILGILSEGDPPIQLQTNTESLKLCKATEAINTELAHGTNLVTVSANSSSSSKDNCLQSQANVNSLNPYMWDNSSSGVHSSVIRVNVQSCGQPNNRRKRSTATETTSVAAQLELLSSEPYKVNVLTKADGLVVHYMNLSSPHRPVTLSVYPDNNETLNVYVGFEEKLNYTNFFKMFHVPDRSKTVYEEQHSFVISQDILNKFQVSTIYIGITNNVCNGSDYCTRITNLTYSYKMAEISCVHWDDVQQVWQTAQCEIQADSTPSKIKFKSNLLGSLGASIIVGPNTINFNTVFDDLGSKIVENIAVVATVLSFILLYIPLALLVRKMDKKDNRKWSVLPLADNHPQDTHCYEVHVYTGHKRHAGTDSNVYIVVAGTEGDTGIRKLSDGDRKNFQQGDISSFLLKTSHALGVPVTIKLWHDSSGMGDQSDWFVSKVVIADVKVQKWHLFMCEKWLSKQRNFGRTECVEHLASSEDIASGIRLFSQNFSKMFSSDHIWYSVAFNKIKSPFLRVQRLNCCLATLMVTMATNAMWYGTGNDTSPQVLMTIGTMSITVHQMYTSVMSSLIIAPPILLIVVLYEKSRPHIKKTDTSMKIMETCISKIDKRSKRLPFWCVYIAHFLVVISVIAGAFFTILYAFEWGKEKSEEWLGCLFMSVFQSILLVQPFKIIIVILVYSMLFKIEIDMNTLYEEIGELETRKNYMKPLCKLEETNHVPDHIKKELEKRRLLEKKTSNLCYEVVLGLVFIFLLLWTIIGNQDTNVYLQNQYLKSTFTRDLPAISTREDVWTWLNNTLLNGIYFSNIDNREININKRVLNDFNSIQIGEPTLRQQRMYKVSCPVLVIDENLQRCSDNQRITHNGHYKPKWIPLINNNSDTGSAANSMEQAFRHKTVKELKTSSFWGHQDWYSGDGYVVKLQGDNQGSQHLLEQLKNNNWIDQFTRVLIVEFTTWNPSTNLFSFVTVSFEFLVTGSLVFKENVQSVQLYRYVGAAGLFNIITEFFTVIIAIIVTVQEIVRIVKHGKQNLFWNIIMWSCLASFYFSLGMYAWRSVLTVQTLEHVMNTEDFVSFSLVSLAHNMFIIFMGTTAFLLELRLLHLLRYIKMISIFGKVLWKSANTLLSICVQFVVIFISFSCLFYLMFGSNVYECHSFPRTVSTVAIIAFDFRGFEKYLVNLGKFAVSGLTIYAFVVTCITMNMFVIVLNHFISVVQEESQDDEDLVSYVIDLFKNILPSKKNAISNYSDVPCNNTSKDFKRCVTLENRMCDFENVFSDIDSNPLPTAVEELMLDYYIWKGTHSNAETADLNHRIQKLSADDVIIYSLRRFSLQQNDEIVQE